MTIDLNAPSVLIFDVFTLTDTLDRGGEFSPLAWQYVVERDLVVLGNLTLVSSYPRCPSLAEQYRLIHSLQARENLNITHFVGGVFLRHLEPYVISIEMTTTELIVTKHKLVTGVVVCSSS